MISYEVYKVVHLASMMVMFTGLSISFYGGDLRHIKMLTGIATLLTLVAGMGLMARLGLSHGEGWPLWIKVKFSIWFVVGIGGAMITRRLPKFGRPAYFIFLLLFVLAAYTAVYKY